MKEFFKFWSGVFGGGGLLFFALLSAHITYIWRVSKLLYVSFCCLTIIITSSFFAVLSIETRASGVYWVHFLVVEIVWWMLFVIWMLNYNIPRNPDGWDDFSKLFSKGGFNG